MNWPSWVTTCAYSSRCASTDSAESAARMPSIICRKLGDSSTGTTVAEGVGVGEGEAEADSSGLAESGEKLGCGLGVA